jgi:HK97 family phage prohead protease
MATEREIELRRRRAEMLDGSREVRRFHASMETRDTSDGMVRFSGYASVTERPYEVASWTETIARGAFRRTLSEDPDVMLLINHGEGGGLPLARTKSGTMSLSEDARGLRVDADLNADDPDVRALVPKLQRGDVDEMSFAFRVTDQTWSEDRSERLIRGVVLHKGDVSIVTRAANDSATGGLVARSRTSAPRVAVPSYSHQRERERLMVAGFGSRAKTPVGRTVRAGGLDLQRLGADERRRVARLMGRSR